MPKLSNRLPAILLMAGSALLLAACGTQDPQTYALSLQEAKTKLVGKESSYHAGNQTRSLKVIAPTANGLSVRMWNDVSWQSSCELHLFAVDEGHTKIEPMCGSAQGSAIGGTTLAMLHQEVDAHVRQILTGEPIDHMALMMKNTAVTAQNLPAMQGEAIGADMQMRAQQAMEAQQQKDDGWGGGAGEELADDW
jgi:hypothetical protein